MTRILFISAVLFLCNSVVAGDVSVTTRVTKIYQYGNLQNETVEDIAVKVTSSDSMCEDGFWILGNEVQPKKMMLTTLISAIRSGARVRINALDNYWSGSPYGRYCQIKSIHLLE